MIVADKFVFIHEPKTGGTFVRKVFAELRQKSRRRYLRRALDRLAGITSTGTYEELTPYHGTCHDIPRYALNKPILSIARNPFDLYVCFYYFGWWATHPEDSFDRFDLVKKEYPNFPDLTFEEFLRMANSHFDDFSLIGSSAGAMDERPGWYTTRFVRYYFKDPQETYAAINDGYISSKRFTNDMFNIHFMRTHRLNTDLHDYLLMHGYRQSEINFIKGMPRVRPEEEAKKRPNYRWKEYYTEATLDYVLRKDKLLFAMFPEFTFDY